VTFANVWALWLLPLAVLPLIVRGGEPLRNAWITFAPPDAASVALGWALRALAAIALASLVLAVADPHRPEYTVERVGRGAEIVLLLDRSRSMDQGFAGVVARAPGGPVSGPELLDFYVNLRRLREPKGQVARQLLAEFAAKREQDRFALIVFSALPIPVLGFTHKQEVIQAAIAAGNVGRGLSETNIGLALERALAMYEDRPYTGSRIVMLVSDGGDRLDPDVRERVAAAARKQRVAIYWLYLRSGNSPGLKEAPGDSPAAVESVPELMLNRFFASLETPYRAYEAGSSEALQRAIADVDRLENLPIAYLDLVPQRDLAPWCHGLALACALLLLGANLKELRRWA